jgi:hypothetical protein
MPWELAQIAVLRIAWLVASLQSVHTHQIQSEAPCPSAPVLVTTTQQVRNSPLAEVNFSGFLR